MGIEKSFSTVSQLIKPVAGIFLTGILSVIIKLYENDHEKNSHIKFLKNNVHSINLYIKKIQDFKKSTILLSFFSFFCGLLFGVTIEVIFSTTLKIISTLIFESLEIFEIYIYNINTNYIFLNDILNSLLYYLFSLMCIILQMSDFCYSSNILIIILLFYLIKWNKVIASKNLLTPIFIEDSHLKPSIMIIYMSYSALIGIIVGLVLLLCTIFFIIFQAYSSTNGSFSFISVHLIDVYQSMKTNIPDLNLFLLINLLGLLTGLCIIIKSYNNMTNISNNVTKTIVAFYRLDFPYVRIITENGEIKGKIRDIKDKSFVTLSEKNILKTAKWNKIEIMEVNYVNNKEQIIFDCNYKNDK